MGFRFMSRATSLLWLSLACLLSACTAAHPTTTSPIASPSPAVNQNGSLPPCLNLNRASVEELKTLPGIGEARARQIVDYRTRHGGFRRPQEIILLNGFGEKIYRALASRICVD